MFKIFSILIFSFLLHCQCITPCFDQLFNISVPPTDPSFPTVSFVENSLYAKIPAFVALPQNIEDIQRCLQCAKVNNIKVAIKAGGHSFVSYSSVEAPGFMISMDKMKNITWAEPEYHRESFEKARFLQEFVPSVNQYNATQYEIVTVQTGARWHDVYQSFRAHGGLWVVTGGLCPSVGVAGFTLGGGVGPCARKFGLAIDNVVGFKMVTEDGSKVLQINETHHKDLFWALRGSGGGNFGAIAEISFKVHEGPKVQSWGTICYNNSKEIMKQALSNLGRLERMFPDNLNADVVIENDDGLCIWVIYLGPKEEALEILQPLINVQYDKPYNVSFAEFDCWWEMIEAFAIAHGYPKDDQGDNVPFVMKNGFIYDLSPEFAEIMTSFDLPDICDQHMIHFGGIIDDLNKNETAFYWRGARYMVYLSCGFENEQEKNTTDEFTKKWWNALSPFFNGSYINFIDKNLDGWKDWYYGGNLGKLLEVKKLWNPMENRGPMHFDQEIDA